MILAWVLRLLQAFERVIVDSSHLVRGVDQLCSGYNCTSDKTVVVAFY